MSLQTYMEELCKEKGCSFRQLSIDIGITYSNMMDIKNGKVAYASDKLLNKLSAYLGVSKEEAMYRTLQEERRRFQLSEAAVKYLSKLYVDKYMITMNVTYVDPGIPYMLRFAGAAYKKRSGNTLTIVDEWSYIKKRHIDEFIIRDDSSFTGDWEQIFVYRSSYISNVLAYALMRVQHYKDIDKLQEYVIIFEEKDKEEMRIAERYLPKKTAFKVKLWIHKTNDY